MTVRTDNLSNQAGTKPPAVERGEFVQGRINFNGIGTVAARDSANVSSLTDNGTGDYSVNWSTAFGNANYSIAGCAGITAGTSADSLRDLSLTGSGFPTAASARFITGVSAGEDNDNIHMMAVGDYA